MLLSLLWDEIAADDMMMFSVKIMKLYLIWNVLLKLNSKSYHFVKKKRIIYHAFNIENLWRKEFEDFLSFSCHVSS